MESSHTSGPGGPLAPTSEERAATSPGRQPDWAEQLDLARRQAAEETRKLSVSVREALRLMAEGREELDDEKLIQGCRKLLGNGLLAKPIADRLEAAMPQRERLPGL